MTHPREYLPILDHIESALEASCGALIALQSIGAHERDPGLDVHVGRAVGSLRGAIEELRQAQSSSASGLALGFVLERTRRAPHVHEPGQSSPRRTA